ncbi:carboxymethylenebutenolidase [Pseudomonas chlororaphis]
MRALFACLLLTFCAMSQAAIKTQEIPYQSPDGTRLIGYYAYDDALKGPRPGVVVVHEWWGLNDYAKRRARDLAALGYSALSIDMYGDGKHTEHPKDAMAFMQAASKDSTVASARFKAGLDLLKKQPQTDPDKLAAIGYCFGGKVVLDAARQGLPLLGVVSFHGALVTNTPAPPAASRRRFSLNTAPSTAWSPPITSAPSRQKWTRPAPTTSSSTSKAPSTASATRMPTA